MDNSARTRPCLEQSPPHIPETPINRLLNDRFHHPNRFDLPHPAPTRASP